MTSLQIQYFLKVADCMSFSQAADELYVSQPSVSRQIQQLEHELGCALFDRSRKNAISLTPAGMVFRDSFRRSLRGFEEAKAAARELSENETLPLRVGIGQDWDLTEPLLRFQEQVRLHYPQAKLYFENNTFLQLRNQVESGQLDVILCTKSSLQNFDHLEVVEVGALESRAYVRRGLLRPENEPLTFSDFKGHDLLMLPDEEAPLSMEIVQLQFLARQIKVNPRHLPNRSTIYQAVLMGQGFTVFDEHMWFGSDPRLAFLRLNDVIPICIVWHSRNQNPLIRLFADTVTQVLREERQEGEDSGPSPALS